MAAKKQDDDRSLKRLGGGRWQTRDERFTIEPQSGTWVLVDAEQTDDLGLPLVRGPFRSLTDAKSAVDAAREAVAPESPLAGRVKEAKAQPSKAAAAAPKTDTGKAGPKAGGARQAAKDPPAEPEPPSEPRWMSDLSPRDRGRARRLVERLTEAGVRDAEGVVRQDLSGGVPTVTRIAVADRLAELLPTSGDAAAAVARALGPLVEALDDGRDDGLEVRWRLVDGDNRPIGLTAQDLKDATKRRAAAEKEKGR
jgi:hypothetical protein